MNIEHVAELVGVSTKRRCRLRADHAVTATRGTASDGGSQPDWTALMKARGAPS
jgi:hypothetical protein